MWKVILSFLLLSSILKHSSGIETEIIYTTKYDDIDMDEVINNERLLKNYVNCLLDNGPCTPDGLELKRIMPEALNDDCKKCSDKQKEKTQYMVKHLIDNRPEYWKPLQEKYDPERTFTEKYTEKKSTEETSSAKDRN